MLVISHTGCRQMYTVTRTGHKSDVYDIRANNGLSPANMPQCAAGSEHPSYHPTLDDVVDLGELALPTWVPTNPQLYRAASRQSRLIIAARGFIYDHEMTPSVHFRSPFPLFYL